MIEVDLLLLSRDASPARQDVWRAIETQRGVRLHVHRLIGTPLPGEHQRWETITRARNEGRRLGTCDWVMYLDDDVVLGPGCVQMLAQALARRPEFAALAADSAGEMNGGWEHWDYPRHVGMAAVVFRRERLASLTFRWEPDKCECLCCCADLRRAGYAIGYVPGAAAWHRPGARGGNHRLLHRLSAKRSCDAGGGGVPGRILCAFNRRDFRSFRRQFLASLRAAGNAEPVTAFAYGLYPSERTLLALEPGVEVVAIADNGVCPALRRLHDFQDVVARWPAETPVAFWDAGDVIFQGSLAPLWERVRAQPERLLVVPDASGYPENPVIRSWSNRIHDPEARQHAFEIMSTHTFLNSGFAAGSAGALMRYLRAGDRLLNSRALRGVGDWGDQPALNLFCHTNPDAWTEIDPGWNYNLAGRPAGQYRMHRDGHFERAEGGPIHVVHGNAGIFRAMALALPASNA